jgi:creatinine amidohydrolase
MPEKDADMRSAAVVLALAISITGAEQRPDRDPADVRSYWLEDLSWMEAEQVLGADTVVLIPLGAAALEHGPHLKLRTEAVLAGHFTRRVASATPVVVAPMVTYHYYPGFGDFPGTTSLSLDTARNLTIDAVRSLARHGPRRFYVLTSTEWSRPALAASAEALVREGLLLRFTDVSAHLDPILRAMQQQEGGGHADEIETSMMLHVDGTLVEMSKAEKAIAPASSPFALTRRANTPGTYSPNGAWGDPTLATPDKGRAFVDALVNGSLREIAALRAAVPRASGPVPPPPSTVGAAGRPVDPVLPPDRCSTGDQRAIRAIGDAFTAHWRNGDAEHLAALWAPTGDIGHPDGFVERTPPIIMINRTELFRRREYRLSRHPMQLGVLRCLSTDIAVADGKWELRDVTDATGKILPTVTGLCTLAVRRIEGAWRIEAYRYTIDASRDPLPTLLKRPGYPGRGRGN